MSAAWSKAVIGASRWLDANTPGGVISSRHIASPTKDWRLGMRVSLYCLLSKWCKTRSSEREPRTCCTIGTEGTHAGSNWMGASDQFFGLLVAQTHGREKTNSRSHYNQRTRARGH